jgi:hypothetical protein
MGVLGHLAGRIATSFTCTLSILTSTWKVGASREELEQALRGHILEEVQLMGRFQHREPGSQAA